MVPKITALQEALPKSIGLLSFDGGIAGNGGSQVFKLQCVCSVSVWPVNTCPKEKAKHSISEGTIYHLRSTQVQLKYEMALVNSTP
jgi:hypothetical protein